MHLRESEPILLLCSHGTAEPLAQACLSRLASSVRSRFNTAARSVKVVECFVDVQEPSVNDVVDSLHGRPAVLVPALLSTGFHVKVDLARAVARAPDVALATTLGPDERLADLLVERLGDEVLREGDLVILASAGSSDAQAGRMVEAAADLVARRVGRPVGVAHVSGGRPWLAEVVAEARGAGDRRVVVLSYVLAPGFFARRLRSSGADVVTPALLQPDDAVPTALVDIVVERYNDACASSGCVEQQVK